MENNEFVTLRLDKISEEGLEKLRKKYDVSVVGDTVFVQMTGDGKDRIKRFVKRLQDPKRPSWLRSLVGRMFS